MSNEGRNLLWRYNEEWTQIVTDPIEYFENKNTCILIMSTSDLLKNGCDSLPVACDNIAGPN